MSLQLERDVHTEISKTFAQNSYFVCGTYEYYHYLCDGFNDKGWGCGYRTLQTICSWMKHNYNEAQDVPSINEIQNILVEHKDKRESFIGSREWIGSFEVCLVLETLYNVPSKIIFVRRGDALETIMTSLCDHFEKFGSPIMMGGNVDCSAKGVMGVHSDGVNSKLLIVDPHYEGKVESKEFLQHKGFVKWQPLQDFLSTSFYNLCLPQVKPQR